MNDEIGDDVGDYDELVEAMVAEVLTMLVLVVMSMVDLVIHRQLILLKIVTVEMVVEQLEVVVVSKTMILME